MIRIFCLLSLLVINCGWFTATAQSKKIIVDCDPGVDDAMALILAIKYPGFDILGITTVFGNAYVD
ncbi:MAG: nucleoside hydrolase [Ginsengibacter sp.]